VTQTERLLARCYEVDTCSTSLNFEVKTTPKNWEKNKLGVINKMISSSTSS